MAKALFRGVCASTITPFGADGKPDLGRIRPHIDWIIADGAHALSPLGSSGEFAALDSDQRRAVLEAALEANHGRLPTVAGTHHCTTAEAVVLSRHAEKAGADSLLVVPPYYMAPTPAQVMVHYRRIAEAVSIPVVLYHNVPLTAVDLRTEHLVRLFEEKAIGGVKMSHPEPDRICELLQATGGKLFIYAGIDTVAFEGLCHGAHGWISGIPSMVPGFARKVYEAIAERSDLPAARALWARLAQLMRLQFSAYHSRGEGAHWFSVMKASLNLIGPPVGDPCPPVLPLEERHRQQLIPILRDLGYTIRGN
ncbi:MAG: dihydrodipicolinate synthase family protein [Planctomycetota bacterium]|nr:dihydrodipicolinate synthase family protein [Planctomycetota bacterium]RLS39584.1 MAG: dihydrodipicolinate synthase family protein [Planctomycetota bacterium]